MKRWISFATLVPAAAIIAAMTLDGAVWAARGFPADQVNVDVFTVMQQKGQKEDFGEPDVQSRPCQRRLFAIGPTPACWWLDRHREIIQRP